MKYRYKKSLTLLEVVIALSMLGLVLVFLLFQYKTISTSQIKIDKALEASMQKHAACIRLEEIFTHLAKEEGQSNIPFYTQDITKRNELILIWDNGVDINPNLCGIVKARLQVKNHALSLEFLNKESIISQQVLLRGVEKVKFSFFDVDKKDWTDAWELSRGYLPPMIKLTITALDNQNWEIPFFLHDYPHIPFYEKVAL